MKKPFTNSPIPSLNLEAMKAQAYAWNYFLSAWELCWHAPTSASQKLLDEAIDNMEVVDKLVSLSTATP